LLALSVLTKYVLVLVGPVLLVGLWRRADVPRRRLVLSLALAVLLTLACYAPFFAGRNMFEGFRRQAALISSSPAALLHTLLWHEFAIGGAQAAVIMKLIAVPCFLITYGVLLTRIQRNADLMALSRTSFWVVFVLLTVATWWFWPWYLGFLLP